MRRNPHLYELNAYLFMKRMSRKYGRTLTLAAVPDEEWEQLARLGFDLLWIMGVWERSPSARQKALLNPILRREYASALPDWTEEDVSGSPYAVYSYRLDPLLGEITELAQLKSKLNRLGIGLILDFVPNHLALEHPWTFSHPGWFVQATEAEARAHPDLFFSPSRGVYLAHGRDPNFPPWTDSVQVNFYSTDMRQALWEQLQQIALVADGVRCDMAMLALNEVFQQVWREFANYPRPDTEFWVEAITRVKKLQPDFLFLGEVYWGLEQKLQQMGFNFTYDKPFYDRLRFSTATDIRSHLTMDDLYQQRSVRFIENHDELRAVTAFGGERSLAAAVILATVPGLRLFHDGQLEGRRLRLPIQLTRQPEEATDTEIRRFYEKLLTLTNSPAFHEGEWKLLEVDQSGDGSNAHRNLLAWCWRYAHQLKIVVINYSPTPARGFLKLPLPREATGRVVIRDELTGKTSTQDANQLASLGLYLNLNPWQAQVLDTLFGNSA